MIEFSMDLSEKLYEVDALKQKVQLRLNLHSGSIPYYDGGLDDFLFTYQDGSMAVMKALSDLSVNSFSYNKENNRIKIMNIDISLNEGVK